MQKQPNLIRLKRLKRLKRRTIHCLAIILLALIGVSPVLADYLGPNRTKTKIPSEVDNLAPVISLPDAWLQWDTVKLDIWDDKSGLSEAWVEITDPKGYSPKIQFDPQQFPLGFKWDRRFGDNTIAEAGTYDLKVIAVDNLGNTTEQNASICILASILPAGPTATPRPTHLPATAVFSPSATMPAIIITPSPAVTHSAEGLPHQKLT